MKNWEVIKTKSDYKIALQRTINIFDANNDAALSDELDLLLVLIIDYEKKHIHLPIVSLIEVVKLKMEEQGMKAKDLVPITG